MVDVVGLRFVAEGERDATNALKRFSDAQERLTRSVLDGAARVQSVSSAWDRANRLYKEGVIGANALRAAQTQVARELAVLNDYTKSNGALNTQRALAELKAAQAARENAEATRRQAEATQRAQQGYDRLRASIDPVFAAQQRMRQVHATVRAALAAETITRQQAAQTLVAYRAQVQLTSGALSVNAGAHTFASSRMSGTGMAVQQAGYQVGDFLVQVQGGTNWMVAFGQQATQLVGVLPMLSTQLGVSASRLIGISAGLGIAIPLVTAIGAYFMRASDSAKNMTQQVDTLKSAIEGLREAAKSAEIELAKMRLGVESSSVVTGLLEQERLTRELADAERELASLLAAGGMGPRGARVRDLQARLVELKADIEAAQAAERGASAEERRVEAIRMAAGLRAAEAEVSAARQADVDAILAAMDAEMQAQQNRLDLLRLTAQFGAESVQVKQREAEIAREVYMAEQMSEGILGNNLDKVMARHDQYELTKTVLAAIAESEAQRTAVLAQQYALYAETRTESDALALSLGEAYLASIGIQDANMAGGVNAAAAAAMILADRLNISLAAAQAMVALAAQNADPSGLTYSGRGGDPRTMGGTALDYQVREADAFLRDYKPPGVGTGAGAGGGGGADAFISMFPELQAAYQEAQRLANLYKQEVDILDSALAKNIITQTQYNDMLLQAQDRYGQVVEDAKRYEAELQRIGQVMESAMTDAFMSIVDGTKSAEDAFKDMARLIIAELFKVLVVQQLVGSFNAETGVGTGIAGFLGKALSGVLGNANGNAFMGGNVVPFARGGVVGSPTMFPMAGGRTGLMGEAGPEAIMPLKRGKDGKLGVASEGGGTTTVNNYFNVSANGDESVKRIVAQQVPAIAEATKAAVMDARQRGGKMRATFR